MTHSQLSYLCLCVFRGVGLAAANAAVLQLVQVELVQLIAGAAHQVVGEAHVTALLQELLAALSIIHLNTKERNIIRHHSVNNN